jgi:hypothetical protein
VFGDRQLTVGDKYSSLHELTTVLATISIISKGGGNVEDTGVLNTGFA